MPKPSVVADACGRALRRAVPALIAACAVVATGSGIWVCYQFVTTSPRFAIESIEIHGASKLAADDVRGALPVKLGDNVFTANLDAVASRLREHPWIASASAHRVLPDTLVVEIRERTAAGIAMLGEPYLVDPAGHPFKRVRLDSAEGAGLIVVTGVERAAYRSDPVTTAATIRSALAAFARWLDRSTRPAIGEVHVDPMGALVLRTYDHGASIELGALGALGALGSPGAPPGQPDHDDELAVRLATFDAAWAALSELERARARTVHLDASSDHVTVAFAKD